MTCQKYAWPLSSNFFVFWQEVQEVNVEIQNDEPGSWRQIVC
jgi:hypothetical protein